MSIDYTVRVQIPQNIIEKIGIENQEFQEKLAEAVRKSTYSDLYHGDTLIVEFTDYPTAYACENTLEKMMGYFEKKIQDNERVQEPLTQEEHVHLAGSKCPNCQSDHFNTSPLELDGMDVWQFCFCLDCGAKWQDNFTLTGYSDLTVDTH